MLVTRSSVCGQVWSFNGGDGADDDANNGDDDDDDDGDDNGVDGDDDARRKNLRYKSSAYNYLFSRFSGINKE